VTEVKVNSNGPAADMFHKKFPNFMYKENLNLARFTVLNTGKAHQHNLASEKVSYAVDAKLLSNTSFSHVVEMQSQIIT
jgi:hypothetical protein